MWILSWNMLDPIGCHWIVFSLPIACRYHLRGSQKSHQKTIGIMIKEKSSKEIGVITTTGIKEAKLSDCSVVSKDSNYWDVFSGWQPLFKDGRKVKDFSIGKETKANNNYATLNVSFPCFVFKYFFMLV